MELRTVYAKCNFLQTVSMGNRQSILLLSFDLSFYFHYIFLSFDLSEIVALFQLLALPDSYNEHHYTAIDCLVADTNI